MKNITLGSTGIVIPQNGFGVLPLQRVEMSEAVRILRRAYEGGMTFFDTAHAYTDSEEKVGNALSDVRKNIFIATKTDAKNVEGVKEQLANSLKMLKTDYIDIYQFHCVGQCYKPGDGTGMYEYMMEQKEKGIIKHIGITTHKVGIAEEIIESGLYETLQYPLSYLSTERELELVRKCKEHNMGFIGMKGLAGGLLTNAEACFAFMSQFDNVIPIWGVQRMSELEDWLKFMDEPVEMNEEIRAFIEDDKSKLGGDFCRGCGYCAPCTADIVVNACARMSLMIRRAPSAGWLSEKWQAEMKKIENCVECGVCMTRCPYELQIPALLRKNYEDYFDIINNGKKPE
ncbi:MAG: aldo/keto reductase [Lachnospiraceae bacterium]|nr:aldo/keto reductase [Lachnospiraceae bacterium]